MPDDRVFFVPHVGVPNQPTVAELEGGVELTGSIVSDGLRFDGPQSPPVADIERLLRERYAPLLNAEDNARLREKCGLGPIIDGEIVDPAGPQRWTNVGYAHSDGLVVNDGPMFIDDPQSDRRMILTTSQHISVTLTLKGGFSRAGWRLLVGPKPPFGCGWRRHHLGRRQIMRRMHAAYGRRTR